MHGLAGIMVPPLERVEYMYELRNIAKNIVSERCEHSKLHPPTHTRHEPAVQCNEAAESFHEIDSNLGKL